MVDAAFAVYTGISKFPSKRAGLGGCSFGRASRGAIYAHKVSPGLSGAVLVPLCGQARASMHVNEVPDTRIAAHIDSVSGKQKLRRLRELCDAYDSDSISETGAFE